MKLNVQAKPNAKKAFIKRVDRLLYVVSVHEQPVGGKANKAIIKALSGYFDIPVSTISIVQGEFARKKLIVVPLTESEIAIIEEKKTSQKKLL